MNAVFYATTGGSTALVAGRFAVALQTDHVLDVKTFDGRAPPADLGLVIAGTPSYGIGDWHFAWQHCFPKVLPWLRSARFVALFGLGDARYHGESFCGGLARLHDAIVSEGIPVAGSSPAGIYGVTAPASLRCGSYPGLTLDLRQSRLRVDEIVQSHISGLPALYQTGQQIGVPAV